MSVHFANFLQMLKKFLITINPKHSITATIEGNVIDIICVGKPEIYTVLRLPTLKPIINGGVYYFGESEYPHFLF